MNRAIITMTLGALILLSVAWATPGFAPGSPGQTAPEHDGLLPDQEQSRYDGGCSARTLPGYRVWQSFTAGKTGKLVRIDLGFFNDMSGSAELRIYDGEGTAGKLITALDVPVHGITRREVTWNSWQVDVPVTAGHRYTFELTPCRSGGLPDPYGVAIGAGDPYPGGCFGVNDPTGSYPTGFDAVFRTWLEGEKDWYGMSGE
jgi:hypothetical protein